MEPLNKNLNSAQSSDLSAQKLPVQSSPVPMTTQASTPIKSSSEKSSFELPESLVNQPPVYKVMPRDFRADKFQPAPPQKRSSGGAAINNSAIANSLNPETPHTLGNPGSNNVLDDFHTSTPRFGKVFIASVIVFIIVAIGLVFAYFKLYKKSSPDETKTATQSSTNTSANQSSADQPVSIVPAEWVQKYFPDCKDANVCGDSADPDKDGLQNAQEYKLSADPNNPDSDKDGLADGDEVNIFGFNPLDAHTSKNIKFDDAQDAKSKWNSTQKRPFNPDELSKIAERIHTSGLHSPTIGTLNTAQINEYTNYESTQSSAVEGTTVATEMSGSALDRDIQRAETIKKISFALLKYKSANSAFPDTTSFDEMISKIKPLIATVAINTSDPVNNIPYVYSYASVAKGADFKLTYYSETQKQSVTIRAADALKNQTKDQAVQRDNQRKADIETIYGALELYANSADNADASGLVKYPSQDKWKDALKPKYINSIPLDPSTNKDYVYTVSDDYSSFALQSIFENPPTGKKGYFCDQDNCGFY